MLGRNGRVVGGQDGRTAVEDGSVASSPDQITAVTAMDGETAPSLPSARANLSIDNTQPYKRRVWEMGRRGLIRRWLRRIYRRLFPEPTPEQIALMDEKKQRELLEKTLEREAKIAEQRMINALTRMGICYEYKAKENPLFGGGRKIDKVKFDRVGYEPNALWFHVDTDRLPHLVNSESLKEKTTIDNLGVACRHAVVCEWSVEKGIWYIMERASGAMGIPSRVAWASMFDRIPASADHLSFGIGLTINNRPIFESLNTTVHWLVAGASGFGKSVFLHNMLCTLISRNQPAQLRIAMVDLKGGNSFQFYVGLPHLLSVEGIADDGICRDRDKVFELLDWIVAESERRMRMFGDAKCQDIGEYNSHRRKNRLAHWLLIIDEWADVYMGSKSRAALTKLVNIAQRCRSVGIHLVVCTQVPKAAVLDTMITANLPGKVVFHFPTFQGSRAALDDGRAHGLRIIGRAIAVTSLEDVQVQTPYISTDMVVAIVQGVLNNTTPDLNRQHDVTQEEVRAWAVRARAGYLRQRDVIKAFSDRGISDAELIKWMKSWDGQQFLINGAVYICQNGDGNQPRRLVAVNPNDDEQEEQNETIEPD